MALLVGSGFYLSSPLSAAGVAAQGVVLSAATLGQIVSIRTNAGLVGSGATMNAGDGFVVDKDQDGSFSDEVQTTQTDNDRYINSIVTYADGSTSSATLELVRLSDGSQAVLVSDGTVGAINAASARIQSITLGSFDTTFNNIYNQDNFHNTITNTVVCFCETTRILTPTGERVIGAMKVGDAVITADSGVQKIVWVGKRRLSSAQLILMPHLRPVRIRAGALGAGVPRADLVVSPQHRLLLVSRIAERMFGQREVLVPAIKLVGVEGIEQVSSVAPVTYVHSLFEAHQVVFANGAPAESLYTGPQAIGALSEAARREIFDIFPELELGGGVAPLVRPAVRKQALVNRLLARHQ